MSVLAVEATEPPSTFRVLIVADQAQTLKSLSAYLSLESTFQVLSVRDVESGLKKAQVEWPSLIVLDLREKKEMVFFCETLKADRGTRRIPIIMLSAANEIIDRIAGLEAGADDYVGKPYNLRELALRVKAVLRRGIRTATEELLVRGPIRVDPARCRVAVDDKQIQLTAVEFKLLRVLAKQVGQVQSREALLVEARGNGEIRIESRTIDTHIRRLRRKLGKAAHLVETVRGAGYRLRPV